MIILFWGSGYHKIHSMSQLTEALTLVGRWWKLAGTLLHCAAGYNRRNKWLGYLWKKKVYINTNDMVHYIFPLPVKSSHSLNKKTTVFRNINSEKLASLSYVYPQLMSTLSLACQSVWCCRWSFGVCHLRNQLDSADTCSVQKRVWFAPWRGCLGQYWHWRRPPISPLT